MIEVKNLHKDFGGVKAVDGCTFKVEENTITSLIGPNGAGKTTTFDMISGLVMPDKGKIKFQKQDITKLRAFQRAKKGISRTFQMARLFKNMSVRDNLALAKPSTEKEMKEILEKVHFLKSLSTLASALSYGQQRLLEIARSLIMPHQLLMLDEPTAGVNPKIRQELKLILKKLKKEGGTVLLIEHDMDFVMDVSDTIIVLNQGKVLKIGTPKQVRKDPKVLEAYLGK